MAYGVRLAPGEVGEDSALVARVVALHGLALGMQVPLLFMVPFGSSRHRLSGASYADVALASSAAFATTSAHWNALIQSATIDAVPVIARLPSSLLGVVLARLRGSTAGSYSVVATMAPRSRLPGWAALRLAATGEAVRLSPMHTFDVWREIYIPD